jgi:GGDEF domain-containing protein
VISALTETVRAGPLGGARIGLIETRIVQSDPGSGGVLTLELISVVADHGEPRTYTEAEALLRDADVAMYRAKGQGKGHRVLFEAELEDGSTEVGNATG